MNIRESVRQRTRFLTYYTLLPLPWSRQRGQVQYGFPFYLTLCSFSTGAEHSCHLFFLQKSKQAKPVLHLKQFFESRLKTSWRVHGVRKNYFSPWNRLVKHRDESPYTDCFILQCKSFHELFCHSITVLSILWFWLTQEKNMKRGSISVTFSL